MIRAVLFAQLWLYWDRSHPCCCVFGTLAGADGRSFVCWIGRLNFAVKFAAPLWKPLRVGW